MLLFNMSRTRVQFFNDIRTSLRLPNLTNAQIERMENPELTFREALGRNLTTQELEWLGGPTSPVRRPRTNVNMETLRARYGSPSPRTTKRNDNNVVYINKTVQPTTNAKIKNKVFLLTELVSGQVKYVYEREMLKKVSRGPFTQKPFEPYHVKSYGDRIPILAKMMRLRTKSWNQEFFDTKVLDDFARGKLKRHHDTFFNLFPTKRSLTKYTGLPNAWPIQNMKSLGEFTAKDMDRARVLKRAIDQESDEELKNLYENRLVLLVSNKYGYRPRDYAPMLRRFINKVPTHMLNVVKV
jgi:hypothetical protein